MGAKRSKSRTKTFVETRGRSELHAFQSTTPPAQHSSSAARCAVAKRVEETKSAQQQHPEVMGIDSDSSTGANGRQCQTRSWAALGTQHCPLVVCESGHDPRVAVRHFGAGSCFVLPPSAGAPWLKLVRLSWRGAGTVRRRGPTWRFEISHLNSTSCFDDYREDGVAGSKSRASTITRPLAVRPKCTVARAHGAAQPQTAHAERKCCMFCKCVALVFSNPQDGAQTPPQPGVMSLLEHWHNAAAMSKQTGHRGLKGSAHPQCVQVGP